MLELHGPQHPSTLIVRHEGDLQYKMLPARPWIGIELQHLVLLRPSSRALSWAILIRDFAYSCEIAGGGDVPHSAIGEARRIQVQDRTRQDTELLEAVQNHTPQVIDRVDSLMNRLNTILCALHHIPCPQKQLLSRPPAYRTVHP